MSRVFTPFRLPGGLTLKNRLVVAPMTTYSSYPDGTIRETELDYLERRASGGFGMVMTAACYVHPLGHAFDGQWGCESDARLPSLRAAADAIHRGGAAAVLQIHHGGRQCPSRILGRAPVSASNIPSERPNADVPVPLTHDEILETIDAYAQAARRAREAGFDGVEIHGANTYLLQQFVSPHSNRRDDVWGADRYRFSEEVTDAVVAAAGPSFPIGYRFSPEESEMPGIRLEHTLELIDRLARRPLAFLHVSLRHHAMGSLVGEFEDPIIPRLLAAIAGRVPFIGVGGVRTLEDAERCLDLGCDLVAIGRAAITEPEWPLVAMRGETPRQKVPASSAAEIVTLPEGLEAKIYGVPGWFEVEEAD